MRFAYPPLALALVLSACSSHIKHGGVLYAEGQYIEAAEVFERTEERLPELSVRERAEYGAYRGLTFLALGDLRQAHRWMTYAYSIERVAPGSLRAGERVRLDNGWQLLGQRLREALPPSHTTIVAARPKAAPVTNGPEG